MAKTKTEIATKVLEELGRLPDGQVAPNSQIKKVKDAYDSLYGDLFNRSLVNWTADGSIPEFAVYPIIQLTAARIARTFGVDSTPYEVKTDIMENKLAEQLANPSEDDTTPGVFF
jgi:hypothetical protein